METEKKELDNITYSYTQNVVSEGPIMISTTEVKGDFVMGQLRDKIVEAIKNGYLKNEESTRVLILSGSHGDGVSGHSGLTDIEKLKDASDNHDGDITIQFYEGDCMRAGVRPVKPRLDIQKLPLMKESIPDITKIKKLNPLFFQNSYLCDDNISKITFQVTSIAYYHKNEEKLIKDIKRFNPKVLALAWCFSINGDVSLALRQEGVFARMVMEHDMREITKNPNAQLDDDQGAIIESIVEFNNKPFQFITPIRLETIKDPRRILSSTNELSDNATVSTFQTPTPTPPPLPPPEPPSKNQSAGSTSNLFIWGHSGTGKTLLLSEALKIKFSRLRALKKDFYAFVVVFNKDKNCALIEDMKQNYFVNLVNVVNFVSLHELRQDVASNKQSNITEVTKDNFEKYAKSDINAIINGLSQTFSHSLLLIDEVPSGYLISTPSEAMKIKINKIAELKKVASKTFGHCKNWRDLVTVANVEWMIGMSPGGYKNSEGGDFHVIFPPEHPNILSLKLQRRYRNSSPIRQFHTWWVEHYKYSYLSFNEEITVTDERMLPSGSIPIWIDRWANVTDIEILEKIKHEYAKEKSVTVHSIWQLWEDKTDSTAEIEKWCKAHGWTFLTDSNVQGTEDECVVILTRPMYALFPEYFSRARNLLIIVTTIGQDYLGYILKIFLDFKLFENDS